MFSGHSPTLAGRHTSSCPVLVALLHPAVALVGSRGIFVLLDLLIRGWRSRMGILLPSSSLPLPFLAPPTTSFSLPPPPMTSTSTLFSFPSVYYFVTLSSPFLNLLTCFFYPVRHGAISVHSIHFNIPLPCLQFTFNLLLHSWTYFLPIPLPSLSLRPLASLTHSILS